MEEYDLTVSEAQQLIEDMTGEPISLGRIRQLVSGYKDGKYPAEIRARKRGNTNFLNRADVIKWASKRNVENPNN